MAKSTVVLSFFFLSEQLFIHFKPWFYQTASISCLAEISGRLSTPRQRPLVVQINQGRENMYICVRARVCVCVCVTIEMAYLGVTMVTGRQQTPVN